MKKITKATTTCHTWHRNDTYVAIIKCRNRFEAAWIALTKGEIEITWQKGANIKDKRLRLTGKKVC